jgi:phosphoribosyl 1,2-cyclic phosphodiesterase
MKFSCFGPRGSMPAPSSKSREFYTDVYGGNTTSYFLEAGPFQILFDMGSGAKALGDKIMKDLLSNPMAKPYKKDFVLLLSHYHNDHIQGIGFHSPFYFAENTFQIHGFVPTDRSIHNQDYLKGHIEHCLSEQQSSPYFPVPHSELPAAKKYFNHSSMFSESFMLTIDQESKVKQEASAGYDAKNVNHILITTIPLNHPNGCLGYRIDYCGKSLAFCTDNEPLAFTNKNINKIAKDVDLLLLDGQYTKEQLATTAQGYGHGNPEFCVDQAKACGAKLLIVHHHDPDNDDNTLRKMEQECKAYADKLLVQFAMEGETWEL